MEIPKIVEELLADKAANNNTIDLDTYANGLLDMYQALQLHKTKVSGSLSFEEAHTFVAMNMPIAVKPVRKSKTALVFPFTSNNARDICVFALATKLSENYR